MSRKKQQKSLPERLDVSVEEISAIVERTQTGALSAEEHAKLKAAVDTFALIAAQLQTKDASLERLRRMIFGATTESTRNVLGEKRGEPTAEGSTDEAPAPRPKLPGHGRNAAAAYTGAEQKVLPAGARVAGWGLHPLNLCTFDKAHTTTPPSER